jgi:hypothetical protein
MDMDAFFPLALPGVSKYGMSGLCAQRFGICKQDAAEYEPAKLALDDADVSEPEEGDEAEEEEDGAAAVKGGRRKRSKLTSKGRPRGGDKDSVAESGEESEVDWDSAHHSKKKRNRSARTLATGAERARVGLFGQCTFGLSSAYADGSGEHAALVAAIESNGGIVKARWTKKARITCTPAITRCLSLHPHPMRSPKVTFLFARVSRHRSYVKCCP